MSGVKHGATTHLYIRFLLSKHGKRALELGASLLELEMEEVFKAYKKHYCEYKLLANNGKPSEARANLEICVYFLDLYSLRRNEEVLSPLPLTNF